MQVSTSTFFRTQSEQLQTIQTESGDLQKKIATGKMIEGPSDDPIAFSDIARMLNQIDNINQFQRNIMSANGRLSMEENALSQAVSTVTRIQELSIYALSDTVNSSDRKAIANEISLLRDMLIDLANTKDANGAALFGGYKNADPVFVKDVSGRVDYFGDDNSIYTTIGNGIEVSINSSGLDTFMRIPTGRRPDGESIFTIVQDMLTSLEAGNAPTSIKNGLTDAINHLTQRQTITGTKLSRLQSQSDSLEKDAASAKTLLSQVQDTNIEDAVTKLKQKLMSLEAGQASFVKIAELTLFNYLR
jgi:flagellar hook-associated protein 3 FlgL